MFLDVVEALPSDLQKQADSSDPFIFPKLEDYPMGTIPSISVPLNFESHSQEFGSRSITGQGTNLTKKNNSRLCPSHVFWIKWIKLKSERIHLPVWYQKLFK